MFDKAYPVSNVELLERKNGFCYDNIDSLARLDEPKLPSREAFYNKLNNMECWQANYAHAQHVWENFHSQNLKEYIVIYIMTDICLLANVF